MKIDHQKWISLVSTVVCLTVAGTVSAQQGKAEPAAPQAAPVSTAFTYQGQLKKAGGAYNGACNFQFSLWDAATGGTQLGNTLAANSTVVSNGLFAVQVNFGDQFSGDARWLQTAVQCAGDGGFTTLSPRTALNATPYALSLRPGATISTTTQNVPALKLNALNGNANALAAFGNGNGFAVVYGEDQSANGGYGIAGRSVKGQGVYGVSASQSGIMGESDSGSGVWGSSQTWYGIDGVTNSPNYAGVRGTNLSTSASGSGVYGLSPNGLGIKGTSTTGQGVKGESQDGYGVWGTSSTNIGVLGQTSAGLLGAVKGVNSAASGIGVQGIANAAGAVGMWGQSDANTGVYGVSTSGTGVWGASTNGYAMYAGGNAGQAINSGGWAKAMVYVDYRQNPALIRCYNSQVTGASATVAPCGFTVTSSNVGLWTIDFGFDVSQRFAAVAVNSTGYCGIPSGCAADHNLSVFGQILSYYGTTVKVRIIYADTLLETNAPFTLILY